MKNCSAYIELLKTFPPRPINTEEELTATKTAIDWEHPDCVRAKHDRRQFISSRQRFTAVMLRPYEYIGTH